MPSLRAHFEAHAAALTDCATLEVNERDGAATLTLRPRKHGAVGVVLYLTLGEIGTVTFDDPASAPAELGDVMEEDVRAIDYFIDVAVEGRSTAFHIGRGGFVEVRDSMGTSRTWKNAWPRPGWQWRAKRIDYLSYR